MLQCPPFRHTSPHRQRRCTEKFCHQHGQSRFPKILTCHSYADCYKNIFLCCRFDFFQQSPGSHCGIGQSSERKNSRQTGCPLNFILTENIVFSSPSAAAGFCVFGAENGRTAWKTESGKTLKELENEV